MNLTPKIREYRALDQLSQAELAPMGGVRRETLGDPEHGK